MTKEVKWLRGGYGWCSMLRVVSLVPPRIKLQNRSQLLRSPAPIMDDPSPFSSRRTRLGGALTGLSRVPSAACRLPLVGGNEGLPQLLLLPVQRRSVEHWNQHLHTRRPLPRRAPHTDDLLQSDKPDAGVLRRQELPGGGAAAVPPGGAGDGRARVPAPPARKPEGAAALPLRGRRPGDGLEKGLGGPAAGLASALRGRSVHPVAPYRPTAAGPLYGQKSPLSPSFFNVDI